MTKEELKLEAIRYLENFKDCANCKNRWGDCADQLDEYCLINGCCFATPKEQDIYLAGAEPREKRIAELKGLKDVATLIRANNDTVVTLMQLNNKLVSKSQQLTKAKVFIRSLKSLIEDICDINYLSKDNTRLLVEAEQFLNSEGK